MYNEKEAHYHYNLFADDTCQAIEKLAMQGAKSMEVTMVASEIVAITAGLIATIALKCASQFEDDVTLELKEIAKNLLQSITDGALSMIKHSRPFQNKEQFVDALKKGLD